MTSDEASNLVDLHLAQLAEHFPAVQIIAQLPTREVHAAVKGPIIKMTARERFWSKVDRTAGPDACWPWTGHKNSSGGHGQMNIRGKLVCAHRLAWIFTNGEIPEGQCVCHKCDNPPCCNPAHFFLGTLSENFADMRRKGRGYTFRYRDRIRGSNHHLAKLNEQSVVAMRLDSGATKELALKYGVSVDTIRSVRARRTWSHVA